jgi:hypothetical protein
VARHSCIKAAPDRHSASLLAGAARATANRLGTPDSGCQAKTKPTLEGPRQFSAYRYALTDAAACCEDGSFYWQQQCPVRC